MVHMSCGWRDGTLGLTLTLLLAGGGVLLVRRRHRVQPQHPAIGNDREQFYVTLTQPFYALLPGTNPAVERVSLWRLVRLAS